MKAEERLTLAEQARDTARGQNEDLTEEEAIALAVQVQRTALKRLSRKRKARRTAAHARPA